MAALTSAAPPFYSRHGCFCVGLCDRNDGARERGRENYRDDREMDMREEKRQRARERERETERQRGRDTESEKETDTRKTEIEVMPSAGPLLPFALPFPHSPVMLMWLYAVNIRLIAYLCARTLADAMHGTACWSFFVSSLPAFLRESLRSSGADTH